MWIIELKVDSMQQQMSKVKIFAMACKYSQVDREMGEYYLCSHYGGRGASGMRS